jgi:SAM-dependent methyltransferase
VDAAKAEEIRAREQREKDTFSKVATGRSAAAGDELLITPDVIARYRAAVDGSKEPVFSIDRLFAMAAPAPGKRFLEICGHHGEYGSLLVHLGAGEVDSVDIAEPLVEMARERARRNNQEGRFRSQVMSVHEMTFPDNTFDVVFGKSSLHHLDLQLARDEIYRVMKPGGYGVFSEPVQLMPIVRKLRGMVPVPPDAESPDEKPLTKEDLDNFARPFSRMEIHYYRLLSRLDRVFRKSGNVLARLDARLLERVPLLRPAAGIVTFKVWK